MGDGCLQLQARAHGASVMPVHPAVKMGWLLLACVVGWLGITGSVSCFCYLLALLPCWW